MLKLECLGAKHGDCIILHHKKGARNSMVLFDGGPGGVYKAFLKPWLENYQKQNGKIPQFTLGMVSHIDDDHINGMLGLMRDVVKAKKASKPAPAEISRFWFNSFSGITGGGARSAANTASITAAVGAPGFDPKIFKDSRTAEIIASVGQGHKLSNLLGEASLGGNEPINGLVTGPAKRTIAPGLVFHIIGPLQNRIDELQAEWAKTYPPGQLAAYADKSVANLSSIVVLVLADGKKVLMTGDARGDDILEGMQKAGYKTDGSYNLDIMKLPHHGSNRNVTLEFFKALPAATYVISADGRHHNPDLDTLTWIAKARGSARFHIVVASPMRTKALHTKFVKHLKTLQTGRNFTFDIRDSDALSISVDV